MRELDLLLEAWLEQRWPGAGTAERAAFERLLDSEDDRLWAWLTGRVVPEDEALRNLIADIAAHGRR
ncbi:MAG: succinate dehydrogenase assembly factor 2 [Wenzhouxiangellaceae bacterium]|nr:succinate dehydrogenase assembly factor 2 [Wenzhouxiangellaceae bacterium]